MQDAAIKVNNLSKAYKLYDRPVDRLKESLHPLRKKYHRDFFALNNVSFEVKKGETVGIIGKNGSGKSTLLKIITGVLTPTSGNVLSNGKISPLLELGAGFNPELTGMENIYFNGAIIGYSKDAIDAKLDDILSFADIGEFIYQPVKIFSSGMFARLAFAVAINVEPDILIIDEVLAVGDFAFQAKCYKRINELRENNVTILYVSHDTYTVRSLCSRALFLKNGSVISYGTAKDTVSQYLSYFENDPSYAQPAVNNSSPKNISGSDNFILSDIRLLDEQGNQIDEISCRQSVFLEFCYSCSDTAKDRVSFAFNLYRHVDQLYICGATTLMDGLEPVVPQENGRVRIKFSNLQLLSGVYLFRIVVVDQNGLGVLAYIPDAVTFKVTDKHQAEGLLTIEREWDIS